MEAGRHFPFTRALNPMDSAFPWRTHSLRKRLLHHVGHAGKTGRVVHRHLRKDLSVQVNARLLQPAHECTVREAVLARSGVDADDPELAKISFSQFPIPG